MPDQWNAIMLRECLRKILPAGITVYDIKMAFFHYTLCMSDCRPPAIAVLQAAYNIFKRKQPRLGGVTQIKWRIGCDFNIAPVVSQTLGNE